MFGNKLVGVLGGDLEGGEIVWGSGIAERDADVAEEAGAFGTLDGRFAEEASEFGIGEREEVP